MVIAALNDAAAIEHEIDRRAAPDTRPDRYPFDDLESVIWPLVGAVAVPLADPGPDVANLQRDAVRPERKSDEERERRVLVRVSRDHEVHNGTVWRVGSR